MKYESTPNGNLLISSEPQDAEMLTDLKDRHQGNDRAFLADLLENAGLSTNGKLMPIKPEDIAALTDAPMLTDDMTVEDDGKVTVNGRVWWYPNYMITNFADVLIEKGQIMFTYGGEAERNIPTAPSAPTEKAG